MTYGRFKRWNYIKTPFDHFVISFEILAWRSFATYIGTKIISITLVLNFLFSKRKFDFLSKIPIKKSFLNTKKIYKPEIIWYLSNQLHSQKAWSRLSKRSAQPESIQDWLKLLTPENAQEYYPFIKVLIQFL